MSDDQNKDALDSSTGAPEKMADRLASLRASIRASKEREGPPADPSSDDLVAVGEPEEDEEEFYSDDTQLLSSDELAAVEEGDVEEPPRSMRESGENFITGDLHRVRPSEEAPLLESSGDGLLAAMDQASEAADEAEAGQEPRSDYDVEPTVVQKLDDLAFVQGTPLYMSPEQCRNDAVTPATDVYSLGVMMFELLEGFPPYVAETVEEVLYKHQDAQIPDQRSEFTPADVKDLLRRMLAKDSADRPDTAEVIDVLQRHVAIGGPDVHGLEEESWSVTEIEPDEPMVVSAKEATLDLEDGERKKLPVWVYGVIAIAVVFGFVAVILAVTGGGPEEPPSPTPVEPVVVAEPESEPEPVEQPEPEEMEFDFAEPNEEQGLGAAADAGGPADAGDAGEADAGPSEEPAVEEAPEPKPKKKRRRRPRRKKKKPELQELRLE